MKMAVGCNVPYTDRPWPVQTWELLTRLQPDEITLTSFIDPAELERLAHSFPDALYHVRPRTGPQNQSWADTYAEQGADILTYRSWPSERSMMECLQDLIGYLPSGVHPRGCHRVTVLMGNEPSLEWASPYPTLTQVKVMTGEYATWYHDNADAIREEFAGAIGVAVAPAAQGDHARELMYISEALRYQCYVFADSFVDHCYFDTRATPYRLDDPEWGGRVTRAMDVIGWNVNTRGRARITESNDNGSLYDARYRASIYGEYLKWAGGSGLIESVSLFTLPGAPDDEGKPSWWFIDDEIVEQANRVRRTFPDLPILPTVGIDPIRIPPAGNGGHSSEASPVAKSDELQAAVKGGQDLTADQLHAKRWQAHAFPPMTEAPAFNPEFGFEGAWRKPENAWWGSPLTVAEDRYNDGQEIRPARVFTNAVVIWTPGTGAEVLG